MKAITKAVLDNKADLGIIFDTDVDRYWFWSFHIEPGFALFNSTCCLDPLLWIRLVKSSTATV